MRKRHLLILTLSALALLLLSGCAELFNKPPTWQESTITVEGRVGQEVDVNLAAKVSDPDNDPITFEFVEAPSGVTGHKIEGGRFKWTPSEIGTYTFKIKAKDPKGGEAVVTLVVNVQNQPPTTPVNTSPVATNNATGLDVDGILLKWESSDPEGKPLKFDLYVGEGENPASWVVEVKDLTTNQYELNGLKGNTVYTWKVVAKDPNGGTSEATFKFKTGTYWYKFVAVEYRAGGPISEAQVEFYGPDGTLLKRKATKVDGSVHFATEVPELKVVAKKYGRAVSVIEGFKHGIVDVKEIIMRDAAVTPDPNHQLNSKLILNVELQKLDGTPLDPASVTSDIRAVINFESNQHPNLLYSSLNMVPGAGAITTRNVSSGAYSATHILSVAGMTGLVPLYVVAYDRNDNRVEKIIMVNIVKPEYDGANLFVPSAGNLLALTRRRGTEFYGINPRILGTDQPLAPPSGSNIVVRVQWQNWLTGNEKDQPEGYVVYRSFDRRNWEAFARVPYSAVATLTAWDSSPELTPGRKVWYAVSSVRGNFESEKFVVGDVEPLNVFDFELLAPENKATNVPRDPTFSWKPSRRLTSSEGTVRYVYFPLLLTFVQSDAWLISPFATTTAGTYLPKEVVDTDGKQIDLRYSSETWYYYWWAAATTPQIYGRYPSVLEAGYTYDWSMGYAYAEVVDSNDNSRALSVAADFFWSSYRYGVDPIGAIEQSKFNKFTTGMN